MRILHVNKFLYRRGGAESYMLDLAQMQGVAGDDVHFFAMQHPDNLDDPNDEFFPSRMELNPPPETFVGRLKTAGGVLYRPSARVGIEQVLDRVKPHVVHLHNIYHQLSPSILRPLRRRGVPTVMTLHDYKLVCPTYQFLDHGKICEACLPNQFRQAAVRRCNQGSLSGSVLASVEARLHRTMGAYDPVHVFICPSAFMRQKMIEGDIDASRLVHVPHFCDISAIAPADKPGSGVLFAGRLSHEKGVDTLVAATPMLKPEVRVTIAGDGPERAALERLAVDLGVSDRVSFLGRIPARDLHARMRAAAVITVPSRWYENQPMTVLEAAAAGRPVVASNLGGLPELIEDGVSGALVPHEDPVALAEALNIACHDPDASHRQGTVARRNAMKTFAPEQHLENLRTCYAQAGRAAGVAS